jgi:hypothetical protein
MLAAALFVVSDTDAGCQAPGRVEPMKRRLRRHPSARAVLSPADVPPSVSVPPGASS